MKRIRGITNRRIAAKGNEFYPTSRKAVELFLREEEFEGDILECACGNGAISKVLRRDGYKVKSIDINDHGYGTVQDFFKYQKRHANIVTNPPYDMAEKFIHHAISLADKKVAMLLRLAFLEGDGRFKRLFKNNPPSRVLVYVNRLTFYPAKVVPSYQRLIFDRFSHYCKRNSIPRIKVKRKRSGGTTAYAWFIFDKEDQSGETLIKWIAR